MPGQSGGPARWDLSDVPWTEGFYRDDRLMRRAYSCACQVIIGGLVAVVAANTPGRRSTFTNVKPVTVVIFTHHIVK